MKNVSYIEHTAAATSFVGKPAVDVFAMLTLASGLEMYSKHRIRPNRAYTPKAMMQAAEHYCGRRFKSRDYAGAAAAVREAARALRATVPET